MNIVMAILAGIGLSAACGFRVFVPLLALGIASRTGQLPVAESMQWVGSMPALIILGVATAVEIGAYYVPWIDNALDAIAGPAAVLAGTFVTATVLGDTDPAFKWSLAIVAGGGAAGTVQTLTTGTRLTSTATTGGLGNPVVSTIEWILSVMFAVIAVVLPLLVLGVLALMILWICRRLRRKRTDAPAASS